MFFKQLFDPASSTLTYLIADDSNHEAVLIDPVTEQVERDVRLGLVSKEQAKSAYGIEGDD